MCTPGERRVGPKSLGDVATLTAIEEVSVYPDIVGLGSAYASIGEELPLDLHRYYDVCAVPKGGTLQPMSIQRDIRDHFPTCEDIEADIVLGGFSSMITQDGPPLRRLVTLATARFAWLSKIHKPQKTVFVEVSSDGEPRAFFR